MTMAFSAKAVPERRRATAGIAVLVPVWLRTVIIVVILVLLGRI